MTHVYLFDEALWQRWYADALRTPDVTITDNGFTANVIEGEYETDADPGDEDR